MTTLAAALLVPVAWLLRIAGRGSRWALRWLRRAFLLGIPALLGLHVAAGLVPYPTAALSDHQGGPLIIEDRHGRVLYAREGRGGRPGRARWVPLDAIAPAAVLTVVGSEDRHFFDHRGVDPVGVGRAALLNARAGRVAYGGSTLTMQLVRMIHSRGQRRTLGNKLKEAWLALRMEHSLSKRQILEQYLNRAYYGHGAYGIEAAARRYFAKPASALSAGEATFLAVIPRGPRYYDPILHPNRIRRRRDHIFRLLVDQGRLSRAAVRRIRGETPRPALHAAPLRAPHFVRWVLATLPESVRRRGGVVRTTLDLRLQERLARRVREHVARLEPKRVTQAGAVVLDTRTGEVRAMVGSAGFWEHAHSGQVNITIRRRHPGSALKPFVYALALERGDHPATIAYDVNDLPGSDYRLMHVTQRERGPVRYREALAGSYNIAAVHTLERVGIAPFLARMRQAGLGPLRGSPNDYGLQAALGAPKIRLIDLAAAYGFLARDGRVTRPQAVAWVDRPDGGVWRPVRPPETTLFSPEVAWLVMDMLADPEARRPMFGQELPFDLPFRVAAKTGTSRGFADTVAVGVTREFTVAAWAGNFDGAPSHGVMAMRGAAPLVRAGLLAAAATHAPHPGAAHALTLPPRPATVVEHDVCPLSGLRPGPHCPHRKREVFAAGHLPAGPCTWHRSEGDHRVVRYPTLLRRWMAKRGGSVRLARR